ncbi:hypothetical protein [Jeotgalibacillus proteolyticus]|uniref:Uncharacterized protein n=1 Tax=Jeotgalibacillus proteolyticus TaxID=2082395 RepID=A0A2S5GF53_9BACL|nr:hypothetical protein [Jeotgalibacillus proteolyticus]PPA71660.1 hypothetical protein C4B60_06285 [Jeotgalibacillus proteolyticus]
MFMNIIAKWSPNKEQNLCEAKLRKVMKRLRIDQYNYNWDRSSCLIEFTYLEKSYRLEHSIDKAKKTGIIVNNGMDCLYELTSSLEDLSEIINRGTYKLEKWIHGMEEPSEDEEQDYEEEYHIRYKTGSRPRFFDNRNEAAASFEPDSPYRDYDRSHLVQRQRR